MPGNPGNQFSLVLFAEFHRRTAGVNCLPQLFQALIRLPRNGEIGKNHGAVFRDIPENLSDFFPLPFTELE